jgi:hypothetical protein
MFFLGRTNGRQTASALNEDFTEAQRLSGAGLGVGQTGKPERKKRRNVTTEMRNSIVPRGTIKKKKDFAVHFPCQLC